MIMQAHTIMCNHCGHTETQQGTKKTCERIFKAHSWQFIGNEHFCKKNCLNSYQEPLKNKDGGQNG